MPLDVMTPDVMAAQVKQALRRGDPRRAVFTLIVGAGFSYGVVPLTRDMMRAEVGAWMSGDDAGLPLERKQALSAEFWRAFNEDNRRLETGCRVDLDGTHLPIDPTAAYQTLCRKQAAGGIATVQQAREFLRAMVGPSTSRLNGAHFFLAAVLDAQRRRELTGTRPFCRTIFTTNFDPLLQVALQLMGVLYYMTDRPELTIDPGHMLEDDAAVHLVYAHGSIHRPYLANDPDALAGLKTANAGVFRSYLEDHGVIVVGYSGWDDSLMAALVECTNFANNLYWCDVVPATDALERLSPYALGLLAKRGGRFYVPLGPGGADSLMGLFFQELVRDQGIPRLLTDPFAGVAEQLGRLDLTGVSLRRYGRGTARPAGARTMEPAPDVLAVAADELRIESVRLLERASGGLWRGDGGGPDAGATARHLLSAALERSLAGQADEAVELWSAVIKLTGAPAEQVALALVNRGVALGKREEWTRAEGDFTAAIDLPGAPAEQVARALVNRGIAREQAGATERELEDYTRAIDLPGASAEQVARALVNRGITWTQRKEWRRAEADYTRVVHLPGAPVDQVARALVNRGLIWDQLGEPDREIADYTRVIDLPGAPLEQVARALFNRAVTRDQQNQPEDAEADYTRVIELAGAPVEQVAAAVYNRGVAREQRREWDKAEADYTLVIDLPGAPVEQLAQALVARAGARSERGDAEGAAADHARVIDLPGAPPEQMAQARANRGWASYLAGQHEAFLADTQAAIDAMPTLDSAAFNLGLALLACGRDADALEAYGRAGRQFPGRIDELGLADLDDARRTWLSEERGAPVIELLRTLRA
jgi:tetratricopeptide (TPR) repeat protein